MIDLPEPLAQCRLCMRIMHRRHLRSGHCRDAFDCCAARMHRWRARQTAESRLEEHDASPEDDPETDDG